MASFTLKGTVKDPAGRPIGNVKVFAIDSDQGFFEDHNDDLLGASWVKPDGSFEISFSDSQFKESIVEGKVDLYFVVRNSRGEEIGRTDPSGGFEADKNIEIVIKSVVKDAIAGEDLYSHNIDRTMAAFAGLGDVATINNSDATRIFSLLDRSINSWVVYTRENEWKRIGYDGPQVPERPRAVEHRHRLEWEAEK